MKQTQTNRDDATIRQALKILEERMTYAQGLVLTSPEATRDYLKLKLKPHLHEVFSVLFLDNRHRLIAYEERFSGTIDGSAAFTREVVKAALRHNAAALILAHNHPSGITTPSDADKRITARLKEALTLVDVRVIDSVIVGEEVFSFAEAGLL